MKRCAKSQDTAQVEKPVPANILQKRTITALSV